MADKDVIKKIIYYVHSKCCRAHWELVIYEGGEYDLLCGKCKRSIGPAVMIVGTLEPKCDECHHKDEGDEQILEDNNE